MKKYPNLILGLLLIAVLALGSLQGLHVTHLRESTLFYRWLVGAATAMRVEGRVAPVSVDDDSAASRKKVKRDDRFFADVAGKIEKLPGVPEVPVAQDDMDKAGKPHSKLVRMVRIAGQQDADGTWDKEIWRLATSAELLKEREDFLTYLRARELSSVGTQFDLANMYGEGGATVSLTNMFFGFRKMAANLLWLQVDKYWHKGMLYRMVPLMKATVALDPNFVDAFLLGAWHLAYNATAQMKDTPEPLKKYYPAYQARLGEKEKYYYQAVDFLKDGINKNPRNYKLYFDLGFAIYEQKLDDYANAAYYLSEAMRYKHDKWVPRQLARARQLNGEYEAALAGWKKYLADNPDNVNAPRFIKINTALLKETEADKAETAGDSAKATALRAEARALWEEIKKEQDPIALVRLARMDALKLASEGRYLEANGLLDKARYDAPDHFDEISQLMIKLKKQGKIRLSLSEVMYLNRKAEADKYIAEELKQRTGKTYTLADDDVWYENGYNKEPTTLLTPGSKDINKLRAEHPDLDPILAFKQPLVFKADGVWYKFRPRAEV